MESKE